MFPREGDGGTGPIPWHHGCWILVHKWRCVSNGGLWAPDLVGSEITLAVLGSSQSHAAAALEARSRELAMWLDVNGHGESWLPAEMASDVDLSAIPIDLSSTDRTVQRDCPSVIVTKRAWSAS